MASSTTYAAGVLCWRRTKSGVRVLLVRRPDYDDVSIPKGKVDQGELLPQTAVRELLEETGVKATLGAPIGVARYQIRSGPKVVHYWLAEVDETAAHAASDAFVANAEISGTEWVQLTKAKSLVTYDFDRDLLEAFEARLAAGTATTFPIIVARHGKAMSPSQWKGSDRTRPLLPKGLEQAEQLALSFAAFAPVKIVSSSAVRCLNTVGPIARRLGLPVRESTGISQDAYEDGVVRAEKQIAKRLERREAVVICSHGPVIPQLIDRLVEATGAPVTEAIRRAAFPEPGDFTVFHIAPNGRLIETETHQAD